MFKVNNKDTRMTPMAKKRLQHGCFLVNFAKFYRAPLGKFFNKVIETFAKKIQGDGY